MVCYKNIVYGPTAEDAVPDPLTNAVIPTTGKPKLRIQAVYGDDGVQIAYYEYTLTVDAVIYVNVAVLADIEAEAKRLQTILKTPGYSLVYYPVGLGEQGAVIGPRSANFTFATSTKKDVKGGPYPQNVVVEPVASNNAILISWEIMFRLSECPALLPELIQFNSELDFDVDDEGDLTFHARITYQKATPITDISTLDFMTNILKKVAGASFQGMRRRKRTSFSRDQRIAMVHFEYKTVKSDNAFFRNTHNIEATDTLQSDLLPTGGTLGRGGFQAWNRKVTATITLPLRVHKSYAWFVYLRILQQRFRQLHQLGKLANLIGNTPAAGQVNAEKDKNFYLLTRIVITEPIYSRSITFETDYLVVTDLSTIFKRSKIGERVNTVFEEDPLPPDPNDWTPKKLSDQWADWQFNQARRSEELSGLFVHKVNGTPIVYNQCTSANSGLAFAATQLFSLETENAEDYESLKAYENEKYSWLHYGNEFGFEEKANTVQVSYLQAVPTDTYVTTEADASDAANRSSTGMSLHGRKYPLTYTKPNKTITRGPSAYKLRMKGSALRIGYPIDFPAVCKVGTSVATRADNPIMTQKQISTGDIPVYLATWDIVYYLDNDPNNANTFKTIVTSGDPAQYS